MPEAPFPYVADRDPQIDAYFLGAFSGPALFGAITRSSVPIRSQPRDSSPIRTTVPARQQIYIYRVDVPDYDYLEGFPQVLRYSNGAPVSLDQLMGFLRQAFQASPTVYVASGQSALAPMPGSPPERYAWYAVSYGNVKGFLQPLGPSAVPTVQLTQILPSAMPPPKPVAPLGKHPGIVAKVASSAADLFDQMYYAMAHNLPAKILSAIKSKVGQALSSETSTAQRATVGPNVSQGVTVRFEPSVRGGNATAIAPLFKGAQVSVLKTGVKDVAGSPGEWWFVYQSPDVVGYVRAVDPDGARNFV